MADPDWLSAREVQERLLTAGLPMADMTDTIGWFARNRGLVATGFGRSHASGGVVRSLTREHVPTRMWRVFLAGDKPTLERTVSWTEGQMTWLITCDDATDLQETWDSIHFDRVSAESMIRDVKARAAADVLQQPEIERWITAWVGNNGNKAWAAFSREHGARRGKRRSFTPAWKKIKGDRRRGRPPRNQQVA